LLVLPHRRRFVYDGRLNLRYRYDKRLQGQLLRGASPPPIPDVILRRA
jgi:hypothetical protein